MMLKITLAKLLLENNFFPSYSQSATPAQETTNGKLSFKPDIPCYI